MNTVDRLQARWNKSRALRAAAAKSVASHRLQKRPTACYPRIARWFLERCPIGVDSVDFRQREVAAECRVSLMALHNALRRLSHIGGVRATRLQRGPGGGSTYQILSREKLELAAKFELPSGSLRESTTPEGPEGNYCARPNWNLRLEQLQDPEGIREAYDEAVAAGLVERSDHTLVAFFGIVAKGLRVGRDLVRFVAGCVWRGLLAYVKCCDEDRGRDLAKPKARDTLPTDPRARSLVVMLAERFSRCQAQVVRPHKTKPDQSDYAARKADNDKEVAYLERKARIARLIHEGREGAKARLA